MEKLTTQLEARFTLKRKIGNDELEIALDVLVDVDNYTQEMRRLQGLASASMRDWVDLFAAQSTMIQAPDMGNIKAGTFEVTFIQPKAPLKQGGKPYFAVKGGDFEKFGVTCWREQLIEAEIDPAKIPIEGTKPTQKWLADYSLNEKGKVDRILKLYLAQAQANA